MELIFRGTNFREFDIFKKFRGTNFREIEAKKYAKINSANINSAKINPFQVAMPNFTWFTDAFSVI